MFLVFTNLCLFFFPSLRVNLMVIESLWNVISSCLESDKRISLIFVGKTGLMEVPVGIIAVFDGHNGAEASEMASKILLEYFVVHTYFLLDATYSGIFKRPFKTFSNEREHGAIFNQLSWRDTICNRDLELGRCLCS